MDRVKDGSITSGRLLLNRVVGGRTRRRRKIYERGDESRIGSHESCLCALGAENVRAVGDESLSNQRRGALGTDEAVVVPVAILERDELGAADACDRFGARVASLSEQVAIAVGAIGFIIFAGEPLSG